MRTKKVDTTEQEPKMKTMVYEVKKGDTIQSIAVKFGIAWKGLADINHIKEPYVMKIGQKLKVPMMLEV